MDRRSFIKRSAASGAAAFIGTSILGKEVLNGMIEEEADISVVHGADFFTSTKQAVRVLGGMERFVPEGSTVGLLINSDFDVRGTFVQPDISLATLEMCFDAGAKEVVCLQNVKPEYWKRSEHYADKSDMINRMTLVKSNQFPAEFNDDEWMRIPKIEGSLALEEVEVIKAFKEVDVLINVFIAKHHAGTIYTGALKNSMGFCTRKTNVFYHLGSGERNDPDFLAQCIADINLVRQPDLLIGDATEFILSNGPSGPGEISKLDKVFAGTNIVAMDSLGSSYNDVVPEDVPCLIKAQEMGLGSYDLSELNIVEIS